MDDLAGLRVTFLAGTLGLGGAERQLFYMTRELVRAGAKPRVLSLTQGEFWESRIAELGVQIDYVGHSRARAARIKAITRSLKSLRCDVLQSQHFYTNAYAAISARLVGCREVGAIRNDALSEVASNGKIFGRMCLRMPRTLAANSKRAVENVQRMGVRPSRIRLLPNVLDTDSFQPAGRAEKNSINILTIGRLAAQKRHDIFLDAVSRVHAACPSVRGTIVGDGPDRGGLERQAHELGLLPGIVRFSGQLSSPLAEYHSADIFALTSDHEGMPNVVLEAMACGLPVVTTDAGGVNELIDDGVNGFIVNRGDRGALAGRLRELACDTALRMRIGSAARQSIEHQYGCHTLGSRLRDLYAHALNPATAASKRNTSQCQIN